MSTCWFLLFTGMPHQQPPISIPPPGHPPAPAPHVNPAFFPPQHGGPPPTMVRIKWTYENYNNINWIKFIHSFCYFKKLFLIDYWMFYICTSFTCFSRMQRLDITTHTELHPLCHIQVIIMPDLQQKGDIHIDNTSLLWCNC